MITDISNINFEAFIKIFVEIAGSRVVMDNNSVASVIFDTVNRLHGFNRSTNYGDLIEEVTKVLVGLEVLIKPSSSFFFELNPKFKKENNSCCESYPGAIWGGSCQTYKMNAKETAMKSISSLSNLFGMY